MIERKYMYELVLTTVFDSKVKSGNRNPCCRLPIIGNQCTKYEDTPSNLVGSLCYKTYKQIISIFDLGL